MPIDPIDFAIEQLKRETTEWLTDTYPKIMKQLEESQNDDLMTDEQKEHVRVLATGFLLIGFPMDEYKELHDLLGAYAANIVAERDHSGEEK